MKRTRSDSPISIDAVLPHFYRAAPDRQRAALAAFKSALDGSAKNEKITQSTLATKKDVASYFRRSDRWVDLMAQAGHLPRLRTPGSRRGVRFRWEDVRQLENLMLVEVPR